MRLAALARSVVRSVGSDQVGLRSMKVSTTVLGCVEGSVITQVKVTVKRSVVVVGSASAVHLTWRVPSSNYWPAWAVGRSAIVRSCDRAKETSPSFRFERWAAS